MTSPSRQGLHGSELAGNFAGNVVTEFVGTFFLVITITSVAAELGVLLYHAGLSAGATTVVTVAIVALAARLVLAALINAGGHISGAHYNPAVTVALWSNGEFSWQGLFSHIPAQFAGGFAASYALKWFGPASLLSTGKLGAVIPDAKLNLYGILAVEAVGTFLLQYIISGVATDDRAESAAAGDSIGNALGAAILIGGLCGTGGSFNPVRTLTPMVAYGHFTSYWWAYVIAEFGGALLAATLYKWGPKKTAPLSTP